MINIEYIKSLIESNQLLATGIGLYGMGVITFLMRNVPKSIYEFVKRHVTTSLTITSQNVTYYDALKWFNSEYSGKTYRKIKLTNGRWGNTENKAIKSIGYGHHWLWYKRHILYITVTKESANQSEYDKETMVISKLGRSHDLFDHMISKFSNKIVDTDIVPIYKFSHGWEPVRDIPKRSLDSVFMSSEAKQGLLDSIDKFISSEEWYVKHGIPYQLGILLYGVAGSGKTSLIKSICNDIFGKCNVYII